MLSQVQTFFSSYWQWLLGGCAALILGAVQLRLYLHQTKESRLKIQELEAKIKAQSSALTAHPTDGVEIRPTFLGFDYREIVLDSKELTIVLNDGRSWIDSNRELLRDRLTDKEKVTRVCLIHPQSPYIELLILKNGKRKTTQLDELYRSLSVLKDVAPNWADIEVRGHMRPSPYCLFLTEHVAVVDPFFFFEAGSLPMMIFANNTELYRSYRDDARKLLKESMLLEEGSFPDVDADA